MLQDDESLGADVRRRGIVVIGLVDVSVLKSLDRSLGIGLGSSGKAPGSGGGAHEKQRLLAVFEKRSEKITVEVAENQPLRASGCPGQDLDIVCTQPAVPDFSQGLLARKN